MNTDLALILTFGARPDFDADERCLRCSAQLDPMDLELAHERWSMVSCPSCGVMIAA